MKNTNTKTIVLSNSFHNTKIRIKAKSWMIPNDQATTWMYIQYRAHDSRYIEYKANKSLAYRIKNKLCGNKECTCGTVR